MHEGFTLRVENPLLDAEFKQRVPDRAVQPLRPELQGAADAAAAALERALLSLFPLTIISSPGLLVGEDSTAQAVG